MSDLEALIDLADLSVVRSEGVVSGKTHRSIEQVVARSRNRLGFLGEVLVVAFAGGTGSGKSSLINAVLDQQVAQVGVVRPTTDDTLAVIPARSEMSFTRLLSALGVDERVAVESLKASILLDLPDFDSIAEAHRRIVEDVLPRVDAVVWVFDPEKYADRIIHSEFLSSLVPYEDQFVFVLNQADRVGASRTVVAEHLGRILEHDGFADPRVIPTTAVAPNVDVADLISVLVGRLDLKRTAISKLATDLSVSATRGWQETRAVDTSRMDLPEIDAVGLAGATFVSLGVEAIQARSQIGKG